MTRLGERLGITWPVEPAPDTMVVHLPGGARVTRWADPGAWRAERLAAFGPDAEPFWRWQETTADVLWDLAQRGLPWPPASAAEWLRLAGPAARIAGKAPGSVPGLLAGAFQPVAAHLPRSAADQLRLFVDAQLLISAQATSARANSLYGAAALDLPRRGVMNLHGGMGALGQLLTEAVRRQGGRVVFRHQVTQVARTQAGPFCVHTNKKDEYPADLVIFDLPPWDAAALVDPSFGLPRRAATVPGDGWGAFVLYAGIDAGAVPARFPLHHQVVVREPMGEGNTVFLTLSLPDDAGRAPEGHRAVTISTHTALAPWWQLFEPDRPAYEARKAEWTERVWSAAEIALPGIRGAARLALPGTPVTFQRFTHRTQGWVGGFPQTGLRRAIGPRLAPGLWLVGDSIFPGQSTLAVTLGAQRVADAVLRSSARSARLYTGRLGAPLLPGGPSR